MKIRAEVDTRKQDGLLRSKVDLVVDDCFDDMLRSSMRVVTSREESRGIHDIECLISLRSQLDRVIAELWSRRA